MQPVVPHPTNLIDLAYKIVGAGKDIATLKFSEKDMLLQLNALESRLPFIDNDLKLLSRWLGDGSEPSCSKTHLNNEYLQSKINQCSNDISIIQKRIQNINESRKGFLFRKNPSITKQVIDELNKTISSIQNESAGIYEHIHRSDSRGEGTLTGLDRDDKFVCVTDMVPKNPEGMFFDFETTGTDGKPLTCAGKLKAAIIDVSETRTVSAVACGMGGVGKTCAIRAIGRDEDIKKRFTGGVLYFSLGADAGKSQLKDRIAHIIERAGGCKRAEEVRKLETLDDVIDKAVPWFACYPCLFIIDDIWHRQGITKDTLVTLSNLAEHNSSRIVYTTRDVRLQSMVSVDFSPRAPNSEESKCMMLNNANLEYPSSEEARKSFDAILRSCDGLPIALSVAGRAVRFLASKKSPGNREEAWLKYDSIWKIRDQEECDHMTKRLLKSLDFIDPDTDIHHRRFEAMGVLRKGQNVTLKTLSLLWDVNISVAEKEIIDFERFSIVRCSDDISGELVAGLHDIMLDISRARAGDSLQCQSLGLIKRHFLNGQGGDADETLHAFTIQQENELSSRQIRQDALKIESDNYILNNLCWLLKLGGKKEDVLWLVGQPAWIVKRISVEDKRRVLGDVDIALEVLRELPWNSREKQITSDWLHRLNSSLRLSMNSIISYPHGCMPWFQLYGRLIHSKSMNSWVREFLNKIETSVPKPWIKPGHGCLPPAGENLKTVLRLPGYVRDFVFQGGIISVISVTQADVSNIIYDANDGTELEHDVLAADFPVTYISASSFSEDGETWVCGTDAGKLWVWSLYTQVVYHNRMNPEAKDGENTSREADVQRIDANRPRNSVWSRAKQKIRSTLKENKSKTKHRKDETSEERSSEECIEANVLLENSEEKSRNDIRVGGNLKTRKDEEKWNCSELIGHTDRVECVTISTGGKQVVSGSRDKTVRVWERRDGKWDDGHVLTGHISWVQCVTISTDGKQVVSGSRDKTVRVWERRYGKWDAGRVLTGYISWVLSVTSSTDGRQVVSGSLDNTVQVWEKRDGKWEDGHVLYGHSSGVQSVTISTNGRQVVSGSRDKTVRVWEKQDGNWNDGHVLNGHSSWVDCVTTSTDGKQVVSGSRDKTVRVWERRDGKWDDGHVLIGHSSLVLSVTISTDGRQVVSGSLDKTVRVWERRDGNWDDGHVLTGHSSEVECVKISTDGMQMVSGSRDRTMRLWERRDGNWNDSHVFTGHGSWVQCVTISTDGRQVVSGSEDKTVRVWERRDGKWDDGYVLIGHSSWVDCVTISTDGKQVVSGSRDKTVRVWERRDGKWDDGHVLKGHRNRVLSVTISTDGRQVVSGSRDKTVRVWDKRDGKWNDSHVLTGHTAWVRCAAMIKESEKIKCEHLNGTVPHWQKKNDRWYSSPLRLEDYRDHDIGSSHVISDSKACKGLERLVHVNAQMPSKSPNYESILGPSDITTIANIEDVINVLGALECWPVSNGYCLKVSRAPFLIFINLEK